MLPVKEMYILLVLSLCIYSMICASCNSMKYLTSNVELHELLGKIGLMLSCVVWLSNLLDVHTKE